MFLQMCIVAASVVVGQTGTPDEQAIRDVLRQFSEARNAKDAQAAASFFTEDADFVTSRGKRAEGRKDIEKRLATSFTSAPYSKSAAKPGAISVRMLSADCAIADYTWELAGLRGVDGKALPTRKGAATAVLVRRNGRWLIAALRAMIPAKE
jgi:uncharacterized protein (TIGR02246 family)